MRIRDLKVSNSLLTQGSYHTFHILKTMSLGDEENFYVMRDPLGYKVLMPAHFYTHYGFKTGQDVICRVDKINCNGRMFLEPRHPFYREGEVYDFGVVSRGIQQAITGENERFMLVRDALEQQWKVRYFSEKSEDVHSTKVKCRIERIKKGKLYLHLLSDKDAMPLPQTGSVIDCTIVDEKTHPENHQRCFILEDTSGKKHVLKKKYYLHYRLKTVQHIRCMVHNFTEDSYAFLEPENPWYKIGEEYIFKPLEIQRLHFSNGSLQYVLVLDDPHNEPVKVFVDRTWIDSLQGCQNVKCRIRDIRKSRLDLEIIEVQAP